MLINRNLLLLIYFVIQSTFSKLYLFLLTTKKINLDLNLNPHEKRNQNQPR
jgi:hypothetical protein